MQAVITTRENTMWQKMNAYERCIYEAHMLAFFVVYKGDSRHLLEKRKKEENLKLETKKRRVNQGKNDNEKT